MKNPYWNILVFFQILILLIGVCYGGDDLSWDGSYDQELVDEVYDAEILKAVQDSMKEYYKRHAKYTHRKKRAEPKVCYPDLGCFESTGPFSYLDALPASPTEVSTTFLLYPGRRHARSVHLGETPLLEVPFQNLSKAYDWATRGGFNNSQTTKILVHGFGSSCSHVWVYEMRSALMAVEDCNIVCVDWENGATLPNYVKAAANTRLVGKQLSLLLKGLETHAGLSRSKMHLIGFSLGAHVAGFAGHEMPNISRITGLDPAGPLFESQDPIARLDEHDAQFVDVIHSNGENLILGGLGSWTPMGHVDFYPNGGRMQNGCSNLFVGAFSDIIWSSAVEGRSLCNHRRAYKFFTDSISPRCHFPAFPCDTYEDFLNGKCFPCIGDSCGNMGYYADKAKGRGQLFLITRDEEPFCAHQYNVKIDSSPMKSKVVNYGKIKITLIGDSDLNETFVMTKKDDEQLMPGKTLSKILVPHPIIAEPKKVEILYQGYSGWLSSGLKLWSIDKVSLMDSFGSVLSVCNKGLVLESGVPILMDLNPGDCTIESEINKTNIQANEISNNNFSESNFVKKFIPTPVVHIGNEAIIKKDINLKTNDQNIREDQFYKNFETLNNLYNDEVESTRALNTKITRTRKQTHVEVAEPVLKIPTKNARATNLEKEILEPILGPTTSKTTTKKGIITSKLVETRSPDYYIEDMGVKRSDVFEKKGLESSENQENPDNPLKMIMMTVQFLPQRLSKMFDLAEKYARETIFPLISKATPRFITNFIAPSPKTTYVPLNYTGTNLTKIPKPKIDFDPPNPPLKLERTDPESENITISNIPDLNKAKIQENTSNLGKTENSDLLQKSSRIVPESSVKLPQVPQTSGNVPLVTFTPGKVPQSTEHVPKTRNNPEMSKSNFLLPERRMDDDISVTVEHSTRISNKNPLEQSPRVQSPRLSSKAIKINLPVFDESDKGIKYIPLLYPDALKSAEKIS